MQIAPIRPYNMSQKQNNINFKQVILKSNMSPIEKQVLQKSRKVNKLAKGLADRGRDLYCSCTTKYLDGTVRKLLRFSTCYPNNLEMDLFSVYYKICNNIISDKDKIPFIRAIDYHDFDVEKFLQQYDEKVKKTTEENESIEKINAEFEKWRKSF